MGRIMPDPPRCPRPNPGAVNVRLHGKRCGPSAADSRGLGSQRTMWQAPGTWRLRPRPWLPWVLSGKRVLDVQGRGVGSAMWWPEEETAGENVVQLSRQASTAAEVEQQTTKYTMGLVTWDLTGAARRGWGGGGGDTGRGPGVLGRKTQQETRSDGGGSASTLPQCEPPKGSGRA